MLLQLYKASGPTVNWTRLLHELPAHYARLTSDLVVVNVYSQGQAAAVIDYCHKFESANDIDVTIGLLKPEEIGALDGR